MKAVNIKLQLKEGTLLQLHKEGKWIDVTAKACFPWSEPTRYLVIQNFDGQEIAFVTDPDELDTVSKCALKVFQSKSGFVFQVRKVLRIEEGVELRTFEVETDSGLRVFHTELDEWPQVQDNGRIVSRDISGDLYQIDSFEALDSRGQKILAPLVK